MPRLVAVVVACLVLSASLPVAARSQVTARDRAVPRYAHILVIMEENKDYGEVIGSPDAPTITALARTYGNASHFYAETHPSEPNYVALLGGSTFGIRDDDAYFCRPRDVRPACPHAQRPGYVDHTVDAPSIASQLRGVGDTWKAYLESIPAPGSLAVYGLSKHRRGLFVYAAKHAGFVNFRSVQRDPRRARHLVGFAQLFADLKSARVPNFALIVPNVCNEMHGSSQRRAPADCRFAHPGKLIWRGDRNVAKLVAAIRSSPIWRARSNVAIVVTFDENGDGRYVGCCGNDPRDPANRGGGRIPTIVITNHGPRHRVDSTPYSHYALLRTIEDAFGIHTYLLRAGAPGVVAMLPLFAARPR